MKKQVILLNGPSGSGKSTLAKALRERIEQTQHLKYGIVSIDDHMRISTSEPIYEDDVFEISGEMCARMLEDLRSFDGVIVDHVITSERIFRQFTEAVRPYALFRVHITCPLGELKRREIARGDRHPGTAESSFTYLYPKDGYDLTVDTSERTTAECAGAILEAVFSPQITLRPMTPEMYRVYLREYENDPDLWSDKSRYVPYEYSEERVEQYVRRQIDLHRVPLAIMRGEEIIGEIVIKNIKPHKCATIGLALKNTSYKDRGYGTQAERLAIRYVFDELDIPTLYADALLTNTRSVHVLEKAGFISTGEDKEFRYYRIDRSSAAAGKTEE